MVRHISLAIAALLLASCGADAENASEQQSDPDAVEPTRADFDGISSLTPEARTYLSKQISRFGGSKSIPDLKTEIVRSVLQVDYNDNGLSKSDMARNFRERESADRIRAMVDIFSADDNGDGVVTKAEFDLSAAWKEIRREKRARAMADRIPSVIIRTGPKPDPKLGTMTAFRNADLDGDGEITLKEAYLQPKSGSAKMAEQIYRYSLGRSDAFVLDFNKDKVVTVEEIEAGVDLFVQEAKTEGISFPEVSAKPKPRPHHMLER